MAKIIPFTKIDTIAFKDMEFEVAVAAVLVKRYGLSVEAAALRMGIEPEAVAIALQTTE